VSKATTTSGGARLTLVSTVSRFASVKREGPSVVLEADLAAAYPKVPGLSAFTRTFRFDGSSTFTVSDGVTLKEPLQIEWRLQSDTPFEVAGKGAYRNAGKGAAAIEVVVAEPKIVAVTTAVGKLKVPGPPGSITSGPEEDRGHVLTATVKAPAGPSRIEATLQLVK